MKPYSGLGLPPEGFEEAGEPLTTAVIAGLRSEAWAIDIGRGLGYSAQTVKGWLEFAKQREVLRKRSRECMRRLRARRAAEREKGC